MSSATLEKQNGRSTLKGQRSETSKLKAMLENSPTNILMANPDLEITYVNPASLKTLKAIEHLLPVPAEQVLGSKIDIFYSFYFIGCHSVCVYLLMIHSFKILTFLLLYH